MNHQATESKSRVQGLRNFFERLDTGKKLQQRDGYTKLLQDQAPQEIVNTYREPTELSAAHRDASTENGLLGPSLALIKNQYFDRAPMNHWIISLELRKAISYDAPLDYQKHLLHLLSKQAQKMDELCIGIAKCYEHQKPSPSDLPLHSQKKDVSLLSFLSEFFAEGFSRLFKTNIEDNDFVEEIKKQANIAKQFHPPLTQPNHSLEEDFHLRPTQAELQAYPQALVDIIEEFLLLIEKDTYQEFLERIMTEEYKNFTQLEDQAAHKKFLEFSSPINKQHFAPIFKKTHHSMTREALNLHFQHQQKYKNSILQIERRKKLNTEFREMMQVVLYSLLLNLRKTLSTSPLWADNNPPKLLKKKSTPWILKNQDSLKDYLKRFDSDSPKDIPIEYPIDTAYTVRKIYSSPEGEKIELSQEKKKDDAPRWIARVARCEVAPTGNITIKNHKIDLEELERVFSSNKHFLEWLRNDPSVSFFYDHSKEDKVTHPSGNTPKLTFTINISDIKPVDSTYFYNLRRKVQQDLNSEESTCHPRH